MSVKEFIESIKNEYYEINWIDCRDSEISRNGDIEVSIGEKNLNDIYEEGKKIKSLLINKLRIPDKKWDNYIIITEITDKTENNTLNIGENKQYKEIIKNLEESKDKFCIEQSFFKSYFIRVNKDNIVDYGCLHDIIMFKDFKNFRETLEIKLSDWDDYGFKKAISICIWNESFGIRVNPRNSEFIDYLKTGNNEHKYKEKLEEYSNNENYKEYRAYLEEMPCSLGYENYYIFLKKYLTYEDRKEWYEVINDLAFNIDFFEDFRIKVASEYFGGQVFGEEIKERKGHFLYASFLRGTSVTEIKKVFHPLAIFNSDTKEPKTLFEDDTTCSIEYEFIDEEESKGSITFEQQNGNNILPMRVYGLVGGNGNGKSYKINEIIKRHLEKDNNFAQILHFSLSPVDDLIEYKINGIKTTVKDVVYDYDERNKEFIDRINNEDIDRSLGAVYEKIGLTLVKNRKNLIKNILFKLDKLKENEIKKFFEDNYEYLLTCDRIEEKTTIKDAFIWYIQDILLDLIASDEKYKLWKESLNYFNFEDWVIDIQNLFNEDKKIVSEKFKKLNTLSSGQATILLYITKLVNNVNQRSLIIFDEPETFMHPPMMKSFIRAVSYIINNKNAFCLVATHSPVIIQEIPHCNIYKLNSKYEIKKINYKTYGQNLDTLYKNIYGVDFQNTGYNELLLERSLKETVTEETLLYDDDIQYLGDEAFLRYLILKDKIRKDSEERGGNHETS